MIWAPLSIMIGAALCLVLTSLGRDRPRVTAIGLALGLVIIACASLQQITLTSRAKLISLETAEVSEAEIVWMEPIQGERLNVLLRWDGAPRLYWIPWSAELSRKMANASASAKVTGRKLRVRRPFSGGFSIEGGQCESANGQCTAGGGSQSSGTDNQGGTAAQFYLAPPPSLPEKEGEQ